MAPRGYLGALGMALVLAGLLTLDDAPTRAVLWERTGRACSSLAWHALRWSAGAHARYAEIMMTEAGRHAA